MGRDGLPDPPGRYSPLHFNSHARVGRDIEKLHADFLEADHFNSHARVGRDFPCGYFDTIIIDDFNSHARVGRDLTEMKLAKKVKKFQLTRPREARLPTGCGKTIVFAISTHTPAWGATNRRS